MMIQSRGGLGPACAGAKPTTAAANIVLLVRDYLRRGALLQVITHGIAAAT